jgi:hypothetical protein
LFLYSYHVACFAITKTLVIFTRYSVVTLLTDLFPSKHLVRFQSCGVRIVSVQCPPCLPWWNNTSSNPLHPTHVQPAAPLPTTHITYLTAALTQLLSHLPTSSQPWEGKPCSFEWGWGLQQQQKPVALSTVCMSKQASPWLAWLSQT